MTNPLFLGLTRPTMFLGLPIMYLIILMFVTTFGFLLTLSFLWLFGVGGVGFTVFRYMAAKDMMLMEVFVTVCQTTPFRASQFQGKGVTYRV